MSVFDYAIGRLDREGKLQGNGRRRLEISRVGSRAGPEGQCGVALDCTALKAGRRRGVFACRGQRFRSMRRSWGGVGQAGAQSPAGGVRQRPPPGGRKAAGSVAGTGVRLLKRIGRNRLRPVPRPVRQALAIARSAGDEGRRWDLRPRRWKPRNGTRCRGSKVPGRQRQTEK